MNEAYETLRAKGFHIDVRGVHPMLIKGLSVLTFDTWQQALEYGLSAD